MKIPKWLRTLWGEPPTAPQSSAVSDVRRAESPAPNASHAEGYSADQPIRSKDEDRFNRWPFAKRIAETLAARRDASSLVIAVYGPWGDGKTST
jgi:hypothetical protein